MYLRDREDRHACFHTVKIDNVMMLADLDDDDIIVPGRPLPVGSNRPTARSFLVIRDVLGTSP